MSQPRSVLCPRRPRRRAPPAVMSAMLTLAIGCAVGGNRPVASAPSPGSASAARSADAIAHDSPAADAPVWISRLEMTSVSTGWACCRRAIPTAGPRCNWAGPPTAAVVTPRTSALAKADLLLSAATADRAWLAVAMPTSAGGTTVVLRTDDGGQTWRRSQPLPGPRCWHSTSPGGLTAGRSRAWAL
jgi:hypothetical protein